MMIESRMAHDGARSCHHSDTPDQVTERFISRARRMTETDRLLSAGRFSSALMKLSRQAIQRVHPTFNEVEIKLLFVELHYGREWAERLRKRWRTDGLRNH